MKAFSWTVGARGASDLPIEIQAAAKRMRERGYRATPQRLAVLRALAEDPHQSVKELRRRCARVGTVTVYRTVNLLTELGLARRVGLEDGPRYELAGEHQHHFICEPCGRVFDIPELASRIEEILNEEDIGAEIQGVEIYGRCRGRCPACAG